MILGLFSFITSLILSYLLYISQREVNEWFLKYVELNQKYFELVIRSDEKQKFKRK